MYVIRLSCEKLTDFKIGYYSFNWNINICKASHNQKPSSDVKPEYLVNLLINNGLKPGHPWSSQMTVLQEEPSSLQNLCLSNQFLRLGSLTPAQGDHVQVQCAPPQLLGKAQQLSGRVRSYNRLERCAKWKQYWWEMAGQLFLIWICVLQESG